VVNKNGGALVGLKHSHFALMIQYSLENRMYSNVVKAMKLSYSRQQGCSCSRLPQKLDNEEDVGFMAFPKGKNFMQR
jgi:hypothetical protein